METTTQNEHGSRCELENREPWLTRGKFFVTPEAMRQVKHKEMVDALIRHTTGDWGNVDEADWAANDRAVAEGGRVVSSYRTKGGKDFWLITEADRSCTTLLIPSEY